MFSKGNSKKPALGVYYFFFQLLMLETVSQNLFRIQNEYTKSNPTLWLYRLAFEPSLKPDFCFPYRKPAPLDSFLEAVQQQSVGQRHAHAQTEVNNSGAVSFRAAEAEPDSRCSSSPRIYRVQRFRRLTSLTEKGLTAWKRFSLISSERAHYAMSL